ncbi:MAG: BTAD domain-containing putative transcriptional regulator [Pseudomonadota bacterium]
MIKVQLFGKFEVFDHNGTPVPIAGAKTQGLLAFLALSMEMPVPRDRIIDLFWGDRFSDQARQSLRQALAKLRRVLPSDGLDVILVDQDRIGLNPAAISVDADRFGKLSQSDVADEVFEALSLLIGPLLDGFFGQRPAFEDWIASERQRFNEMAAGILERAVDIAARRGDTKSALAHARHLVDIEPWSDKAQLVLLRLMAQTGNRAGAIQAFNTYDELLQRELGISAGAELCALMSQIRGETISVAHHTPSLPTVDMPTDIGGRTSIALVPFAWMATQPDQGHLVDGLVEDMSTKLAKFGWLDIQAGGNSDGARLTATQMCTLFSDQQIDYVVHGSLRSNGNRYRLTVQLADPVDGRYLWVERFDRETDDVFDLQDELSDAVVGSLECAIERFEGRNAANKPFEEMNAWECYHRGLAIQYEFDAATNKQAQKHFRRAIALDPNFALAHARLSYAIVISMIYFEADDVPHLLEEALELARTAARLNPDDAVIRFALGRALLAGGDYDQSILHLRDAISRNPNMAQAHCGLGDSMAYAGELDTAMECFERAVEVCPDDPHRWAFLSYGATALLFRGEYDQAEEWAARAEAVPNCHYWSTAIRTSALAHRGRFAEASDALKRLLTLRPGITCDFVKSRLFYLRDATQVDVYISGLRKAGLA